MIIVIAGIIEKDNKILIARRGPGFHQEGLWEFPGGKIEDGETPEICLERELKEELEIETETKEFVIGSVYTYPGKEICKILAYKSKWLSGEIKLNDHSEMAWVTANELGKYEFVAADLLIVQELRK